MSAPIEKAIEAMAAAMIREVLGAWLRPPAAPKPKRVQKAHPRKLELTPRTAHVRAGKGACDVCRRTRPLWTHPHAPVCGDCLRDELGGDS